MRICAVLAAAGFAGADQAAAGGEPLEVVPARLEFQGRPDPQRILVSLNGADVTAAATPAVEPADLAEVTPHGILPKRDGEGRLIVRHGDATATVPLIVRNSAAPGAAPPSFLEDVQAVLTRAGCNQGACHGKLAGQNGFKLSLRGYAPEWDYDWLARDLSGRRLNQEIPADSLLLRKATGDVFHGGGRLIRRDGREWNVLADWIRAGAPGPKADEPRVEHLEIAPGGRRLAVGTTQPLLVRARYADGTWRDATWLAKFASNDESVVSVSADGIVTAKRSGETTVRAHFQEAVALIQFTIPFPGTPSATPPPGTTATANHPFDGPLFAKLAALGIPPSPPADDATYFRRVHLDLIGTLPGPTETAAFLADGRPTDVKRAELVDRLLASSEFTDFWTLQWSDLFQNRRERDHDVRGMKGVRNFHAWLRDQVARNRPWNELVHEVLTARGKSAETPAVGYFIVNVGEERHGERSEVVAAVAQAFLGTRIGCAKCHNHPLERYTQDDYYHFAGFFSRVKLNRKSPAGGDTELVVSHPDEKQNKNRVGVSQPRTHTFLTPRPLDRRNLDIKPEDDPREHLANWIVSPENEYFTGSIVNRLWKHFFFTGLVEPVDDLRASNPPSNPDLMKALQRELVQSKFDLKHVMRKIVTSQAYALQSTTVAGNETDDRFYSHYYPRRLAAEVLLDAMSAATQVPDRFPGCPEGIRAIQLPDSNLESYFLSTFGRSGRVTACACERNGEVTIAQLLHLLNGDGTQGKIHRPESRLSRLLAEKKSDEALLDELFLATLGRKPTDKQRRVVAESLAAGVPREEVFRDMFWALLNSSEFSFNR